MEAINQKKKKTQRGSFKIRAALLLIQILLPFGLYVAMMRDSGPMMWLIGILFTLSVGLLVWLG